MRSIFTDKVSDTMPLPEYPRPQLVRDGWQNLNGLYDYKISDSSEKKPNDIDHLLPSVFCQRSKRD